MNGFDGVTLALFMEEDGGGGGGGDFLRVVEEDCGGEAKMLATGMFVVESAKLGGNSSEQLRSRCWLMICRDTLRPHTGQDILSEDIITTVSRMLQLRARYIQLALILYTNVSSHHHHS